ncbi:MAG: hypothetical protein J6Y36_06775 [Treponema sp.]|nr:hypothetical protein [Treponema sp.]
MSRFLCICLSSTIQRTVGFKTLNVTEVNRADHYRQDASGKAVNSARVLNMLEKGCVRCICPLGEKNKDIFLELAEDDCLEVEYVTIPGFTRECWTLLDFAKEETTELVVGEKLNSKDGKEILLKEEEEKLLSLVQKALENVEAVLIAGSRPVYFSKNLMAAISKMCMDKNKILLADYWGEDLRQTLNLCTPSIIKINEEEFISTFNIKSDSEDELKNAVTEKSRELDNVIVVTRSVKPVFGAEKGNFIEVPSEKVKAVNTTACGDSFSAGFLFEYSNTGNFEKALKKGIWCAARNAESEVPGSIN